MKGERKLIAPTPHDGPEKNCCVAWWAEAQRASLLLERLAEDHFPDQQTFDAWIARQLGYKPSTENSR